MSSNHDLDREPQRQLVIELCLEADADIELTERVGRQLRADLNQLDIDSVSPATSGDVEYGAKGAAIDWTSLLVTFSGAGGIFTSVIAAVQAWFASHSAAQSIKITLDGDSIELGRSSEKERRELIQAWTHRHSGD